MSRSLAFFHRDILLLILLLSFLFRRVCRLIRWFWLLLLWLWCAENSFELRSCLADVLGYLVDRNWDVLPCWLWAELTRNLVHHLIHLIQDCESWLTLLIRKPSNLIELFSALSVDHVAHLKVLSYVLSELLTLLDRVTLRFKTVQAFFVIIVSSVFSLAVDPLDVLWNLLKVLLANCWVDEISQEAVELVAHRVWVSLQAILCLLKVEELTILSQEFRLNFAVLINFCWGHVMSTDNLEFQILGLRLFLLLDLKRLLSLGLSRSLLFLLVSWLSGVSFSLVSFVFCRLGLRSSFFRCNWFLDSNLFLLVPFFDEFSSS